MTLDLFHPHKAGSSCEQREDVPLEWRRTKDKCTFSGRKSEPGKKSWTRLEVSQRFSPPVCLSVCALWRHPERRILQFISNKEPMKLIWSATYRTGVILRNFRPHRFCSWTSLCPGHCSVWKWKLEFLQHQGSWKHLGIPQTSDGGLFHNPWFRMKITGITLR